MTHSQSVISSSQLGKERNGSNNQISIDEKFWGRHGFDEGIETCGACREGCDSRKTIAVTFIVANDENYALAA